MAAVRPRPMHRGVLQPLLRARVASLGAADSGFTLVEALAAFVVFAIFMTGLTSSMITLSKTLLRTRVRTMAVNIAQQEIERARAMSYANFALDAASTPTPPARATLPNSSTLYDVATQPNCTNVCLTYQRYLPTSHGVMFKVTDLVLKVAASVAPGDSGQPLAERDLVVTVEWTSPTVGKVQMTTTVTNATPLQAAPPQGIVIYADDSSTGTPIGQDAANETTNFDVTVTSGTTVVSQGTTDEGMWSDMTVPVGSYTCTISNNDSSASWVSSTGGQSYSTPCEVTVANVTTINTTWTKSASCPTNSTKGSAVVAVTDTNDNPVANVAVQDVSRTGSKPVPAQLTNSTGQVTFTGATALPADKYTFTVTNLSAYQNASVGPVCIYANRATTAPRIVLRPTPTGPVMTINVPIKNNDASKVYWAQATNGVDPLWQQGISVAYTKQGTVVFDSMPVGTYTVTVCIPDPLSTNCDAIATFSNQPYLSANTTYTTTLVTDNG